jgi:hypothetical protein
MLCDVEVQDTYQSLASWVLVPQTGSLHYANGPIEWMSNNLDKISHRHVNQSVFKMIKPERTASSKQSWLNDERQ